MESEACDVRETDRFTAAKKRGNNETRHQREARFLSGSFTLLSPPFSAIRKVRRSFSAYHDDAPSH